jgi:hypothetical protein
MTSQIHEVCWAEPFKQHKRPMKAETGRHNSPRAPRLAREAFATSRLLEFCSKKKC